MPTAEQAWCGVEVLCWVTAGYYFRFVVDGIVYEPRVLPFGMQLSPWAWTKVLRPVVAALRARGHKLNAYVDDFAATGRRGHPSSAADATAGRREIAALFLSLGPHVHPTKGKAEGTCQLPLLGFLVDSRRRLMLLPAERLTKLVSGAKSLLSAACRDGRRVRHRVLQRFTGTADSCFLAIPSARFFLRRLYDAQGGLDRAGPSDSPTAVRASGPPRHRSGYDRLAHGALDDLRWFAGLGTQPGVGRALWQPHAGVLTTDASSNGWGGHLGSLLPAAGFFINGFTSRSPALMTELRRLHVVVASLGVSLKASWLPSVANVWADTLSRMRDRADHRMCDTVSRRLDRLRGVATIDMFASAVDTRCTRFFSRMPTPGCEGVDVFTAHWGGQDNRWIFPPFTDAWRVVEKIIADGATATVILPVWQAQDWWVDAVAPAQEAHILSYENDILLSGNERMPAQRCKWHIAAFRF
eukprot:contig_16035_g3849